MLIRRTAISASKSGLRRKRRIKSTVNFDVDRARWYICIILKPRVERDWYVFMQNCARGKDRRLSRVHVIKRDEVRNRKMLRAVVVEHEFPRASEVCFMNIQEKRNRFSKRARGEPFFDFTDRLCTRSSSHLSAIFLTVLRSTSNFLGNFCQIEMTLNIYTYLNLEILI